MNKSAWHRKAACFETVVAVGTMMALLVLAVLLIMARWVGAEELPSCTSIKAVQVDPRFIVKQPDGDTFHVFNFDVPNVVKIRVKDADTPERGQDGYQEAKEFTREWLQRGTFRVVTCGEPTLDRIVGVVMRDGKTLADELKAAGYWREVH